MKKRIIRLGALLGVPPVVWACQGLIGWWASAHSCGRFSTTGLSTVRSVMAAIGIIALCVTIAGLADAVRLIRLTPAGTPGDVDRVRFYGLVTLVFGTTLSLGVLFATLPSILLTHCGVAQ